MPRHSNPQHRLACDRCHAQKLRCQRQEGQSSCVRCTRTCVACVFSPRQRHTVASRTPETDLEAAPLPPSPSPALHTRAQLPASVPAAVHGEQNGVSALDLSLLDHQCSHQFLPQFPFLGVDTMDSSPQIDWSALFPLGASSDVAGPDLSADSNLLSSRNFLSPEPGSQEMLPSGGADKVQSAASRASSSAAEAIEENPPMDHYVRQLAGLNVQLYDHAKSLPSLSMVSSERAPTMDGSVFAIDKTFFMTQTLVDLVGRIYAPPVPDASGPGCGVDVDQGTVLLLLSCANKVFDIYEVIVGHMRGCIKHKLTPVTADGKTLLLPQLRIGSFAPPTPGAMAVHMLMVVMMASNLFD